MDWLNIDRDSSVTLTDQLFLQIRDAILAGILPGGSKLPPSRLLAMDTGISRNIVVIVYEQLIAESYLESIQGKGTFVKKNLLFQEERKSRQISERTKWKECQPTIDLTGGIPDLTLFPVRQWLDSYKSVCYSSDTTVFAYPDAVGETELREEISRYLLRSKGLIAPVENIIITGGSSHNFTILSEVLNKHKRIILEDPFLKSIRRHFQSLEKEILPVRVDRDGLRVEDLPEEEVDFVVATPSHQYPLAVTLSAQRRIELIGWVKKRDSYILEDDYDSEFRYGGNRLSTMYSLSPERVVYSGTFSKSLSPALRMGYMVLPASLIDAAKEHVRARFLAVNKLDQLALAEFIRSGGLERDLSRRKKAYARKFHFLQQSITRLFRDKADVLTNQSGLHLILHLKHHQSTSEDIKWLRQKGVIAETVAMHAIHPAEEDCEKWIIAFSNISEEDLLQGLKVLKEKFI